MASEEGELVQLFVYDLSGGMAQTFSQMLLGKQVCHYLRQPSGACQPFKFASCNAELTRVFYYSHFIQIDGIWHSSIVIGGLEYYFGRGISVAPAHATPYGIPIKIINLGHTQLDEDIRAHLLVELSERFTPESYSLFNNNCNNFSNEFAQLLVGKEIPTHIVGLPAEVLETPFGQMIRPMLAGLEAQLGSIHQQLPTAVEVQHPQPSTAEEAHQAEVVQEEIEVAVATGMMEELVISGEQGEKGETEKKVQMEYERLMESGTLSDHDARAKALENVAAQQQNNPQAHQV